eukprot:g6562.t1
MKSAAPAAAAMPAAPPMPAGMGYANNGYGAAATPAAGLPPPPPPLPPGTVVPQSRPLPPAMPAVAAVPLGGLSLPAGVAPAATTLAPPAVVRKVLERPANGENVQFPSRVSYFEGAEDLSGDKEKGLLRVKNGQMVVVYKTDDPHWWLGKVGDEVGWIPSQSLQEIDPKAPGRQQHAPPQDVSRRTWGSKKKEAQMAAGELDMEKTDFSMTNATTFDHHTAKITAFFIQVSGVKKSVKEQGDIWVVAKTLKAFNRLRVAWEEDYGASSIPVEPPPARWADCSESDWKDLKGAALRTFLEEVKQWPNLKHSQDLKHFLTTDRVNLSGGIISKKTMKPYLDAWIKTSSEPSWTLKLPSIPSKESADGGAGKPAKLDKAKKAAIPGLRAGDESFGQLTSQRPKLRRSRVFDKVSALAAVTKQEAMLETSRRGWTHAGLKLQLLTQGGDACSLKRRSERNIFYKYYAEDGPDDAEYDSFGKMAGSRVLMRRGGYNQMKSHMRYNLERVVYGRMENAARESETKYAVYAKQKEQEKLQKDNGVGGGLKRGGGDGGRTGPGGQKKSSAFQLESITEKLEKVTKMSDIQSGKDSTLDRCQYMSRIHGRFTMPVAAQLMALNELGREELELFVAHIGEVHESSRPKLDRMKELDSFLEDKRVRCHQLVEMLDRMHTPDERLLVVLTCCARLTDAVEADDQNLFKDIEGAIDPLNLKRARLVVDVLVAEAQAEDASRASRKATREVHADVQRARKALGFLSKAVEKIRSGTIAAGMFEELKERLEAAADAAHEEYCDAVKDAKPANEYAEQAVSLMEEAERLYEDLDDLGTGVKDRVKVIHNSGGGGMGDLEAAETEESILVSALEVALTIASNAHELATRAADNARFDMQSALEEVATAEKIIRRVELEERRARTECDAAEGTEEEAEVGDCKFGEWAEDAKLHGIENLEKFRKAGKYRLHLDKTGMRGSEDMLMMATLISKVQLLRDLRILQAEAKAEEAKRQESLLQSSSKRRRRSTARRENGAAPARHAPLRQQSTVGDGDGDGKASPKAGGRSRGSRSAPLRQQSDLFEAEQEDGDRSPSRRRGKARNGGGRGNSRPMGEIEDQVDEEEDEDEDEVSSAEEGSGSDDDDDDDGSTSSSDVDSVFGSDLDAGDDDLGPLRKSAVRRSRNSGGRRGSVGTPAGGGLHSAGAGGATRRHDKMRKSLIGQTLGKRGSIGTKSLAKSLAPTTPRPEARRRRQKQSSAFDFAEEDMGNGGRGRGRGREGDEDEDDDGEDYDYGD